MSNRLESDLEKSEIGSHYLPNTLTKEEGRHVQLHDKARKASLSRTQSISLASGPARPLPRDRLGAEFKTLSLHVTLTREGDKDGTTAKKGKQAVKELAELDWQTLSIEELATRLGVAPQRGLDLEVAARRLANDGPNVIKPPKTNWPKKIFWYIFGGFNSLLSGAAVLCFISWKPLGEPDPQIPNLALAVVLMVVVSFSALFNAWQDFSTSRIMQSISGMLPADVETLRDGVSKKMPSRDLVAGDVVVLNMGTKVPADCRIITCTADAAFDRSVLTGESEPVIASIAATTESFLEAPTIALQGSLCVSGSVTAIVLQTGDKTVFGRISTLASRQTAARTTLENEVLHFVLTISGLALVTVIIIVILWAAWLRKKHPNFINVPNLLIDIVGIAVAFIPEGLPICVTLSLSIIANRMKSANVLCKELKTVETLGCIDVMLSDKTGTLTTNVMTVMNTFYGLAHNSTLHTADAIRGSEKSSLVPTALATAAALNNDAKFEASAFSKGDRAINGDATDSGLLRFADTCLDGAAESARERWRELHRLAFNSKNKFALKLFQAVDIVSAPVFPSDVFDVAGDYLLLVKGAPDILLKRCSHILDRDGTPQDLAGQLLDDLVAAQTSLASSGQRVLLLARRLIKYEQIPAHLHKHPEKLAEKVMDLNQELEVIGLVALMDPPRSDTLRTVETCRRAGIRFCMVTGDFAQTAQAIASNIGIFTQPTVHTFADLDKDQPLESIEPYRRKAEGEKLKSLVLSGSDLLVMTDSTWKQTVAFDEIVFARTSPEQKLKIVKAFQNAGHVCGATGDGTNDAAALKQAQIGIAFANGSSVAIEAADLVLLGDLSAIVDGIRLGRLVFDNLRKTIAYLLPAGSFSELMPVLAAVLFGLPQVLSSIQMILICCLTDLLNGLSMVKELPEADLLLRMPRRVGKDRLADWKLLGHSYIFLGVPETLTSMAMAFYFAFVRRGIPFSTLWLNYGEVSSPAITEATYVAQSIYFFNLVIMQIGNLLASRTRKLSILQQDPFFNKATRNLFILVGITWAVGVAIFFSYVPAFHSAFGTRQIPVEGFFIPLGFGLAILIMDEVRKLFVRRSPNGFLGRIAW